MKPHECPHCRCYESPRPIPVSTGDRIRNRLTGEVGTVEFTQAPNPPWHYGGVPYVSFKGFWHYYDVIPRVTVGQRIRNRDTDEVAEVIALERGDAWSPRIVNARWHDAVWYNYLLVEEA